jgi:hypothetical protein
VCWVVNAKTQHMAIAPRDKNESFFMVFYSKNARIALPFHKNV